MKRLVIPAALALLIAACSSTPEGGDQSGAPVESRESRSSLQLSLENKQVLASVAEYVKALAPAIDKAPDALGLAFAINGAINSADLYPSHGLFRKLWPKLLNAAATEAVAEKNGKHGTPPKAEAVLAFLDTSERGKAGERRIDARTTLATRETEKSYYFEARRADGASGCRRYSTMRVSTWESSTIIA